MTPARCPWLILLMALCVPSRGEAQYADSQRAGLSHSVESPREYRPPAGRVVSSGSHWLNGFVIGSIVGAIAVIMAPGQSGGTIRARNVAFAIGIGPLIGGVPGALIGSLFKKDTGVAPVQ